MLNLTREVGIRHAQPKGSNSRPLKLFEGALEACGMARWRPAVCRCGSRVVRRATAMPPCKDQAQANFYNRHAGMEVGGGASEDVANRWKSAGKG
ncbi:uncharacterized protein SCHCODRAFT_02179804 [Schizophyllum commune H4-8]|uniref:uncharacterized protein n=1 Tax=Schizophyllum commune (strain H4-8 / FGSC 9210) TaxID=578458 RepID=UPI00215ED9DE|nr:uncharacterized protein SCHCODRAFT_02179804 [Schizophyllum commune H4-8]KAI5836593.1 hypothetical protein SCHCODRAFT_02179804 [Schizophyllum commune H4-8]